MAHQQRPWLYSDLYLASRCTRGRNGGPCYGIRDVDDGSGRNSCPICLRVKSALHQQLVHGHALEQAVNALDPNMPELPIGAHWIPGLQAVSPQQIPRAAPDPSQQRARAYVRNELGMMRRLVRFAKPNAPIPPGTCNVLCLLFLLHQVRVGLREVAPLHLRCHNILLVGATPSHAGQTESHFFAACQWTQRVRMRVRGTFAISSICQWVLRARKRIMCWCRCVRTSSSGGPSSSEGTSSSGGPSPEG